MLEEGDIRHTGAGATEMSIWLEQHPQLQEQEVTESSEPAFVSRTNCVIPMLTNKERVWEDEYSVENLWQKEWKEKWNSV